MEDLKQIKISFKNSEKILTDIPSSFDKLEKLFHLLFEEAERNKNYIFKYKHSNNDKYLLISEERFLFAIDELKVMNNPIIYVEDKNEVLNSNNDSNISNPHNFVLNFFNNKSLAITKYVNSNNAEEEDEKNEHNINISMDKDLEKLKELLANQEENLKEEMDKNMFLKKINKKIMDINEPNQQNEGINIEKEELIENYNELKKRYDDLENKNRDLYFENRDLKREVNNPTGKKEGIIKELIDKNKKLEDEKLSFMNDNKNLKGKIDDLEKNIFNINLENKELKIELTKKENSIKQLKSAIDNYKENSENLINGLNERVNDLNSQLKEKEKIISRNSEEHKNS